MTIVAADEDVLIARNPASNDVLGRVPRTAPEAVADAVARAREAQARWGALPWSARRAVVKRWWQVLSRQAETLAESIRSEVGKPLGEARAELLISLDAVRWTVKRAGRALRAERIGPGWQRWFLVPSGRSMTHRPIGVIGMIGTWNYPVFLNAPAIAQALAAGNAVVWKPSELAPLTGWLLQRTLDAADFPEDLVTAVFGGPEIGSALVESEIDKGMFTGGVENGRRVLGTLAGRGIPAVAELSGFDPALVLPDAPLNSTLRALTWGAFVGCGQTCVAVKRVYVVGDPAPWAEGLAERARRLRVGDPASSAIDVGPMISESAPARFLAQVGASVAAGARLLTGGEALAGPGSFAAPTVLLADSPGPEAALAGVFGPVTLVRGVAHVEDAITAANASEYGLSASVWGRNRRAARAVADRIVAGSVTINDVVAPTGHAAAPFGGTKASGIGRTHGVLGLREFTQPHVRFERGPGGFRPQVFPYSDRLTAPLELYRRLFHPET